MTEETKTGLFARLRKAAYTVVGAPVVAGRRIAETTGRVADTLRKELDEWADEGERMTARLRERPVVEELKERVDFEHLQGRVERLRDQLEDVLANWREGFTPHRAEPAPAEEPEPAVPVEVAGDEG
jgi:hypothetical protein